MHLNSVMGHYLFLVHTRPAFLFPEYVIHQSDMTEHAGYVSNPSFFILITYQHSTNKVLTTLNYTFFYDDLSVNQ